MEVFRYFDPVWSSEEIWYAPDCLDKAFFGTSLDASGDHVAVGSYAAYSCVPNPQVVISDGAGYVVNYNDPSDSWNASGTTNKLLAHYPESVGLFGTGISIDGEMVAVGGLGGLGGFGTDGGQVLTYSTLLSESLDCDGNGPDALEWCSGIAPDCNNNEVIDACDIASGTSLDCDSTGDGLGNGIPDECEIASGTSLDCDGNGVPDNCDIFYGTGVDCDGNGVLDACELTNGLHLIFIVDGSGISQAEYDLRLAAITQELCTDTTYSQIDPLIVSVIRITNNPQTDVGPIWFQPGVNSDAICSNITALSQFGSSTNLLGALEKAKEVFDSEGPSYARELVVFSVGNALDWAACQAEGNQLRSLTPPVKIDGAQIRDFQGMCNPTQMRMLANTQHANHNPNQPTGYQRCLETSLVDFHLVCQVSVSAEWGSNKDCNVNGLLDFNNPPFDCDPCTADIAGSTTGADGFINVSDMLLVVAEWGVCPDPLPCPGDLNCDGFVDISDLLVVIGNWGQCGGTVMGLPQTVQDCLNRFPLGSLQLEKCLELVEYLQNQGN